MKDLPFRQFSTTGARALAEWERLRAAGGGWPIIVGGEHEAKALAANFEAGRPTSVEDILQRAENLNHRQALAEEVARSDAAYRKWAADNNEGVEEEPDPELGEWPEEPIFTSGPILARDIVTMEPLELVPLLLVPAQQGWQVPAHVKFGDFNACPPPHVHVAALRAWQERYGAELVSLGGATMELRVKKRPKTREEAVELAWEQYRYCPDIVTQGVGDIYPLAAVLMASDWWYFWWD
ncbi:MAG TPA: DUF4253 domain-containing protein [Allosphingosinicella sp.]|uniref:DUF4253 domain-containing protein n=1 Tax=Allosphingosinicella sp. TaxID=2823234 RepID=UPI002EDA6824